MATPTDRTTRFSYYAALRHALRGEPYAPRRQGAGPAIQAARADGEKAGAEIRRTRTRPNGAK